MRAVGADVEPKPKGWRSEYGGWFRAESVASRYHLRPPYPDETFRLLEELAADEPRAVLDAGCGLGELARPLAARVGRIDAVDLSAAMIARGRALPDGDAPNLRWIHAAIEDAPLDGPYALIVAGDSIHWFDWGSVLPRMARALTAHGLIAIVQRQWLSSPELRKQLGAIYARHSANPDFAPLDPVAELERRNLFQQLGEHTTDPVPWTPTLDDLVDCHHSQAGFVYERMRDVIGFQREVSDVITRLVPERNGRFQLDVTATIVWGRPPEHAVAPT